LTAALWFIAGTAASVLGLAVIIGVTEMRWHRVGRPSQISIAMGIALILTSCGADGTLKTPAQMTPAERCANAQGTLLAMKVGGAWPSSIAEGEKTVAEICE
jgi:hypothetical protein